MRGSNCYWLPFTGLWITSCEISAIILPWLIHCQNMSVGASPNTRHITWPFQVKPGAFRLWDAFCNLLAAFTDSILAPRWRGSCFRRPWRRKARRCGWTSATCHFKWTRPPTAPSSSSPWPSTTSLMTAALSEPGQQKVFYGSESKSNKPMS